MENRTTDETEPTLAEKVAFLSSPAAHAGATTVDVRETHMSWVFLAGDRVHKLKKPVKYPFLDYSTAGARRAICEEEVRLNRRLAPDVYLGVSRLTLEEGGALAIDGEGRAVDWLVRMRRLPEALLLDTAIQTGAVDRRALGGVADRLARFYLEREAEEADPAEHVARFARELKKSREVFAEADFRTVGERGDIALDALEELLNHAPDLVADRVRGGRIVEGHGDLRPEHVCLTDPPVVIDCLEFSRELRLVDPFDELCFLSMECAAMGARWIGPVLIDRCAAALHDRPPDRLLAFYTIYRASLRARLALAHLLEPEPRTPDKWVPLARRYLDEAEPLLVRLRPPEAPPASRSRGGDG